MNIKNNLIFLLTNGIIPFCVIKENKMAIIASGSDIVHAVGNTLKMIVFDSDEPLATLVFENGVTTYTHWSMPRGVKLGVVEYTRSGEKDKRYVYPENLTAEHCKFMKNGNVYNDVTVGESVIFDKN